MKYVNVHNDNVVPLIGQAAQSSQRGVCADVL